MTETLVLTVRVAVSLALVLALLWYLSRRLGKAGAGARRLPITVLGRQTLGRRAGVAVVDVAGRTLVLGVSDAGVRLLTELGSGPFELPDDEDAADADGDPAVERIGSDAAPVPPARELRDGAATGSPLAGSILDAESWRTSWQTLRNRGKQ